MYDYVCNPPSNNPIESGYLGAAIRHLSSVGCSFVGDIVVSRHMCTLRGRDSVGDRCFLK